MGRELKRVALDFNWPLKMIWKGYINPYHSQECSSCNGSGLNPKTKQISDDWYDFANTDHRWCDTITQDEVDALIEHKRLLDFTHEWTKENGHQPKVPTPAVTAEMVNKWNSGRGMGHDAINSSICVETRARRLGVYGLCMFCNGEGEIWASEKIKDLEENWHEDEKYEPPTGEGWQLWETVSEGSPISPVFPIEELFVEYLVGEGYSLSAAHGFCKAGYAPSFVIANRVMYKNIESCEGE